MKRTNLHWTRRQFNDIWPTIDCIGTEQNNIPDALVSDTALSTVKRLNSKGDFASKQYTGSSSGSSKKAVYVIVWWKSIVVCSLIIFYLQFDLTVRTEVYYLFVRRLKLIFQQNSISIDFASSFFANVEVLLLIS